MWLLGIPWGAYVADRLDLPLLLCPDLNPKDHGLKNLIEGKIPTSKCCGSRRFGIDQGSSFEAIEGIKAEGMTIAGWSVSFTYGFDPNIAKFIENKIGIWKSLTNFQFFWNDLLHSQYISE